MSLDRLRTAADPARGVDDASPGDRTRRGNADAGIGPGFPDPSMLARSVLGGLVATVVMTAYRLPIARSLPPTATFWAAFVGAGDPEDYPGVGLLLHLGYGTGAGAAFALLYDGLEAPRSATPEGRATLWGLAYGLALSLFGERVLLERLLDRTLSADERTVFHAGHVIYGLTLGTWVGSRAEAE